MVACDRDGPVHRVRDKRPARHGHRRTLSRPCPRARLIQTGRTARARFPRSRLDTGSLRKETDRRGQGRATEDEEEEIGTPCWKCAPIANAAIPTSRPTRLAPSSARSSAPSAPIAPTARSTAPARIAAAISSLARCARARRSPATRPARSASARSNRHGPLPSPARFVYRARPWPTKSPCANAPASISSPRRALMMCPNSPPCSKVRSKPGTSPACRSA